MKKTILLLSFNFSFFSILQGQNLIGKNWVINSSIVRANTKLDTLFIQSRNTNVISLRNISIRFLANGLYEGFSEQGIAITGTWSQSGNQITIDNSTSNFTLVSNSEFKISFTISVLNRLGGFNDATSEIHFISNNVIPVELQEFKAISEGNTNKLDWQTAYEKNCKGFFIQRSKNTKTWDEISFIGGHGNSTIIQHYSWGDKYPLSISYYRLRQIDIDGKETFSKVVSVVRKDDEEIDLYPNPTNGKVYIETTNFKLNKVKVFNSLGQLLIEKVQVYNEIDIANLPTGIYCIELWSENKRVQKRIFKN